MKTKVSSTRLLVLAGVIFALSLNAQAEDPKYVSLVMFTNKKVAIVAENPQMQKMSLEIINSSTGEIVYNANLPGDAHYRKLYDLSNLPEDSYAISLMIDHTVFEKKLLLSDSKTVLLTETKYTLPAIYQEADNLVVTVLNPYQKDVTVSFWNDTESIFNDKPDYSGSFKRNYNLKNLDPGEYYVEVKTGDYLYNHSFEIK